MIYRYTKCLYFLCICSLFGCKQTSNEQSIDTNQKRYNTITDTITNAYIDTTSVILDGNNDLVDFDNSGHFEIGKIYTDTVVFREYMDYGDFYRFHVIARGKNLYPLQNNDDKSLNKGDIALLKWNVDSIWIPEAPNDKWLSEISVNIRKIKDGKLSLFKKKYPKPIAYYWDQDIDTKYTEQDFDEIYDLVLYYLANSDNPSVVSAVKLQSDSEEIQFSIGENTRDEEGITNTYIMIGLSIYLEDHNSTFQWLYLKRSNYGYRIIYEYDLVNDKLVLFN